MLTAASSKRLVVGNETAMATSVEVSGELYVEVETASSITGTLSEVRIRKGIGGGSYRFVTLAWEGSDLRVRAVSDLIVLPDTAGLHTAAVSLPVAEFDALGVWTAFGAPNESVGFTASGTHWSIASSSAPVADQVFDTAAGSWDFTRALALGGYA